MACHLVDAKSLIEPVMEWMLMIWQFDTKFNEILMEMDVFSFKRMQLNMASAKMAAILFRHQWAHLVMIHPPKKR